MLLIINHCEKAMLIQKGHAHIRHPVTNMHNPKKDMLRIRSNFAKVHVLQQFQWGAYWRIGVPITQSLRDKKITPSGTCIRVSDCKCMSLPKSPLD